MKPIHRLPDADSIEGMQVVGQVVEVKYRTASDEWHSLQMTMPNALHLLVLLSHLPGAKEVLDRSEEFDRNHGR